MKTKSRLALLLCGSALTGTAVADSLCEVDYQIQHSWQTGAVHRVQLTYNGPEVNGWQLGWRFPGQEQIDSIFNVSHEQNGQDVTVSNLLWNARLSEGREIKFGFNVRNPSGDIPETFYLNGQPCDGDAGTPTPDPEPPEDPQEPEDPNQSPVDDGGNNGGNDGGGSGGDDTPPDDSGNDDGSTGGDNGDGGDSGNGGEPTDPTDPVAWALDPTVSHLGFVTTKNQNNVESHSFGTLSGSVTEDGVANLTINLDSVETGIDIRNQRLRELLFNTGATPNATVAIELGDHLGQVLGLSAGEVLSLEVPADVQISGVTRELNTSLRVQNLGGQRFLVSSAQPMIITADQFELANGVEALRSIAGLDSISIAVPVDFALFFEADELPTP